MLAGRTYWEVHERAYFLITLASLICSLLCFTWIGITLPKLIATIDGIELQQLHQIRIHCNASPSTTTADLRRFYSHQTDSRWGRQLDQILLDSGYIHRPQSTVQSYVRAPPKQQCCTPGPAGPKGKPGKNGRSGKAGSAGRPGRPGKPAPERSRCKKPALVCNCPAGSTGPPGILGAKGDRGAPGSPGNSGRSGSLGKCGRRGIQGHTGISGRPGEEGQPGANAVGVEARAGPAGPPGAPGREGATGEAGPSGMTIVKVGTPGRNGTPGRSGANGQPGADGLVGEPGRRGEEGVCPYFCNVDGGVFYFDLGSKSRSTIL